MRPLISVVLSLLVCGTFLGSPRKPTHGTSSIYSWHCFVCVHACGSVLCLGGVDKTLCKGRIIVLISSREFDSFLIHGENPLFLWRISILSRTYAFFIKPFSLLRDQPFFFFSNLANNLEHQWVNTWYCLYLTVLSFFFWVPTAVISTVPFYPVSPCNWLGRLLCGRYRKQLLPLESSLLQGDMDKFMVIWCTRQSILTLQESARGRGCEEEEIALVEVGWTSER